MNIHIDISSNAEELGKRAAEKIAMFLNNAIKEKGEARIILSTGMSQFTTLSALVKEDVDWTKVEMFHLDEYVGIDENHGASFRKYLKERFISLVPLKAYHLVDGEESIEPLTEELRKKPVDVGVIGIGENGHIAFNDPPADFLTDEAYKVVSLDEKCRTQQVGEGWFRTLSEVPEKAITMCPRQIMAAEHIVSAVPYKVKAEAVYNTLTKPVQDTIPATLLKTHQDWSLFLDSDSASMVLPL